VARYATSEEWLAVRGLLGAANGRRVLDLGAGNGIAAHAFAKDHWDVTAYEPDESAAVGLEAIRSWSVALGLPVRTVGGWNDRLPFQDGEFDVVFARQVLHHLPNLTHSMADIARILRPGGTLLAIREHVVRDSDSDLASFLERHPLHSRYGGENAFRLADYLDSARAAGLRLNQFWGQMESILNYAPATEATRRLHLRQYAASRWRGIGRLFVWSPQFVRASGREHARRFASSGRIYSFFWTKPA
jgi:SAM-dependent methyltransferase